MTTLPEFLLQRIAEDELMLATHQVLLLTKVSIGQPTTGTDALTERLSTECNAKWRIVEEWLKPAVAPVEGGWLGQGGNPTQQAARYGLAMPVLRLLALPYAGHPDYRSEWAP